MGFQQPSHPQPHFTDRDDANCCHLDHMSLGFSCCIEANEASEPSTSRNMSISLSRMAERFTPSPPLRRYNGRLCPRLGTRGSKPHIEPIARAVTRTALHLEISVLARRKDTALAYVLEYIRRHASSLAVTFYVRSLSYIESPGNFNRKFISAKMFNESRRSIGEDATR